MKKIYLVITLIVISLSSCLPTKKTNYFQGEPTSKGEMYKLNNEPYRLQVNDVLSIQIKSENPELVSLFSASKTEGTVSSKGDGLYFDGYTINTHGNIRIPYIGELNVLGYTEREVREKIEFELKNFIKNPESIFVTVKLSGIKFVVTGEVGSPGTLNLLQSQVTIIEAIANAGEISQFGNRQNVTVLRKTINGVERYTIDMTDIAVFDNEQFFVQPNDVIYVEALQRKSWGFGTTGLQTFTTIASVFAVLVSTILLVRTI